MLLEMETYIALLLISLIYSVCCHTDADEAKYRSSEARLHRDLMVNYTKFTRPVERHTDQLSLKFGLMINSIDGMNHETAVVTIHAWANLYWIDYQLKWNPADYDGIESISLPADQIWHPDIQLYNGVGAGMEKTVEVMPSVSNSGFVMYIPPVTLTTRCNPNSDNFPFDTQDCRLKFGSWVYHDAQLNLSLSNGEANSFNTYNYVENREFELLNPTSARNAKKYACCNETYSDLTFNFTLRRRITYKTKLFVAPSVVLSLMLPAVFVLPPESSEKMTLGIGLLIGHVLLFGQMENFIPHAHPTVPNLAIYFAANLVLLGLSLFLAAIVVNCWGRRTRDIPVPEILRSIFLGILGRMLCTSRDSFLPKEGTAQTGTYTRQVDNDPEFTVEHDKAKMMSAYQHLVSTAEWRQLACVLDRLLLLIFTIITVIIAIALAIK